MKKVFFFFLFSLFFGGTAALAQSAKVVDVKGEVTVKMTPSAEWQKAQINMLLEKEAEVQTQKNSQCMLAFDQELKNILMVKEESHIKIQNVYPGSVFLPQGRVFTLIGDMPKGEQFQVRTPTVVSGARGTGWSIAFDGVKAGARCFDDKIFIQCALDSGPEAGVRDVVSGYGIEVREGCSVSGPFPLDDTDWREWNDFVDDTKVVKGEITEPAGEEPSADSFEDAQEEKKDDFADSQGERARQEAEGNLPEEEY